MSATTSGRNFMDMLEKNIREIELKIFIRQGKYWTRSESKKGPAALPVSNFVMELLHCVRREGVLHRVAKVIGQDAEAVIEFPPAAVAKSDAFLKLLLAHGDFFFYLKEEVLRKLWDRVLRQPSRIAVESDHVGLQDDSSVWILRNSICRTGKWIPAKDGISWDGDQGYVVPLSAPNVCAEGNLRLSDVAGQLVAAFGRDALLAFGWTVAVPFSRPLVRKYGCMPLLHICGQKGCGKTSLASLMLRIFGMPEPFSIMETTPAALSRLLHYYGSLPIGFDELRCQASVRAKFGLLRGAFDRSGAAKSMGVGVKQYTVRAGAMLSGEELPDDAALLSRCVQVFLSGKDRDAEAFFTLKNWAPYLPSVGRSIIANCIQMKPKVLSEVERVNSLLSSFSAEPRIRLNYAIAAGALAALHVQDETFESWLCRKVVEGQRATDDESAIAQFYSDLQIVMARGLIEKDWVAMTREELVLWFRPIWTAIVEYRRRSGEPPRFGRNTLLNYLRRDEPAYITHNALRMIRGRQIRALVLDARKLPPDLLRALGKVSADDASTDEPDC